MYRLGDYSDYHHGYMVPSTGFLQWFGLESTGEGFTLRFPRRHRPTELLPLPDYPKLLASFREYGDLLDRLGISSAGALNDAIQANQIREVILVSEALHEHQIADIADMVSECLDRLKVVTIAGPSSAGKTTFSTRLAVQLLAHGVSPLPFEMDNYFLDREKTPRDESGDYDFESLRALDRLAMISDLKRLIAGETVSIPHYNFVAGRREPGKEIKLSTGQIVILEGIHGFNPELIPEIPAEQTFRIYVSALTQLNLDLQNRVSTTDTRLLRRIVRDARERGYSASDTIQRWDCPAVKRHFPYQSGRDVQHSPAYGWRR
jgi:uridine kinase